tara:strand:+ start:1376 stop:2068 length:693 start_codon:yes stop_codon:yes gene_type:complete
MSKTAEQRIEELQSMVSEMRSENEKLQNYYSQAYKAMEEARQNESYLKGQLESMQSGQSDDTSSFVDSQDNSSIQSMLEQIVSKTIEPRIQLVEKYATDALQQTAGREVDRALKSFKDKHPESSRIMDFERLVMLDASEEVKRKQNLNQPVGDVKEIALKIAQDRVSRFNKIESKVAEENKKRREMAERKAMLPDMFASAGFEDLPKAPENAKEAGDLLEDLLRRQKRAN